MKKDKKQKNMNSSKSTNKSCRDLDNNNSCNSNDIESNMNCNKNCR